MAFNKVLKMASQGAPDEGRSPALADAEPTEAPGDLKRVSASPRAGLPKFRFLEEIRKRNVGRVAILYVVVCWLILEPVHVVFHMLEVPSWANRLVIILLALGFPAALIFAWVYEITPEGLRPTVEVPHGQSIRRQTGRRLDRAIIAVLALALIYFVLDKFWLSTISGRGLHGAGTAAKTIAAAPTVHAEPASAFAPPAHSIAVLPFVNMSGDSQQDYFSDGLSEELLNSLSRITALQVAARTSSFSFKGKQVDIADIARKLNVGAILEGSVRRAGAHVRITAQLINAVTGFHLWSQTYDRDLSDMLALQTEIASAVTTALQATLLGDSAALIELGGTQNPLAFDAYLRGQKFVDTAPDKETRLAQIAAYSEAIRLDPSYAKAYAGKAVALSDFAGDVATGPAVRQSFEEARAEADKALALAPELGEAHVALASILDAGFADYARAAVEYERAVALSPGNALVLRLSAWFFSHVGRT
jgi:TolB-like protein